MQMRAGAVGLDSLTWFSSLSGVTPRTLSPPVSGAELQIPTGGKLVPDSDVWSLRVNSLPRKKLKKRSIPIPTKNNQATLEKGLIPELDLRNNTKMSPDITVPRQQRQTHGVRGTSRKHTEANLKELQSAKLRPSEH